LSNYVYGSMPNRSRLAASILASIPCLGIQTLDESTFFSFLRNMFHSTPPTNDTCGILRWTMPSGLQYFCRAANYNVRVNDARGPAPIDEFQAMSMIRDLTLKRQPLAVSQIGREDSASSKNVDSFYTARTSKGQVAFEDPVNNARDSAILVLPDAHLLWGQPMHLRAIKETIQALENTPNKLLLTVPPGTELPCEIQPLVYMETFDSPDIREFENMIFFWLCEQADRRDNATREQFFRRHGFRVTSISDEDSTKVQDFLDPNERAEDDNKKRIWTPGAVAKSITGLSQALTGLTWTEGSHTLVLTFQNAGHLNISDVQNSKITYLNSHQALSVHHPDDLPNYADVGGYQAVKDYISRHMAMFKQENRERVKELGVAPFKGCLFVGVPGTGKSLVARATARESGMLACELDVGKVMDKFVGGSEQNMRRVIEVMEKAAGDHGLVVIMDEIEKQLAGSSNAGASDAGATSRVHRSFLTWLNDRTKPVIIFMTANNIDQIPPEFLRPGRIDSVFFYDLPGPSARAQILSVHLNRYKAVKHSINVETSARDKLARFTGAEIEQLIKECVMAILHGEANEINDELLDKIIPTLKLQANTHAEQISRLRQRAEEFRLADEERFDETSRTRRQRQSSSLKQTAVPQVAEIDLDDIGDDIDLGLEQRESEA
jgi:ATP-dependent 26S proteasome regulatory subunit